MNVNDEKDDGLANIGACVVDGLAKTRHEFEHLRLQVVRVHTRQKIRYNTKSRSQLLLISTVVCYDGRLANAFQQRLKAEIGIQLTTKHNKRVASAKGYALRRTRVGTMNQTMNDTL